MRLKIAACVTCFVILAIPAYGAEKHQLEREEILFVEPGDSYLALFGPDWMKVFQANNRIIFYDGRGKLTHSPDKLVVGTRLVVPEGTSLTRRAMERLSRYEKIKAAALEAIREAESLVTPQPQDGTEAYRQALQLLEKAREALNGMTFGFENFLEAERLARESVRHFKIDRSLQETIRDMRDLEEEMGHTPYWKRVIPLAVLMALLAGLLWRMRRGKQKERLLRVQQWLNRQPGRIEDMEKVRIWGW